MTKIYDTSLALLSARFALICYRLGDGDSLRGTYNNLESFSPCVR